MKTRNTLIAFTLAAGLTIPALGGTDFYLLSQSGEVAGLDLTAGTVALLADLPGSPSSLARDSDELFIGFADGQVVRLDAGTGLSSGAAIVTPTNAAALTAVGNTLYVGDSGDFDGTVYLYDTTTAQQMATTPVFTDITAIAADTGGLFVGGHTTLAYRGSLGGSGFNFFAACGGLINSMAFDDHTMYLGGVAFFGDQIGTIYQFDKLIGGVSYTGTFGVDSDSISIVVLDGILYVAGSDGVIDRLDPTTGAVVAPPLVTGLSLVGMIASDAPDCAVDFTADGVVDSGDLALFITLFLGDDPAADLTGDGTVDSGDLSAFIGLFLAGC